MTKENDLDRRSFIKTASLGTMGMLTMGCKKNNPVQPDPPDPPDPPGTTDIALVKTTDRAAGVRKIIELLGMDGANGKQAVVKPNWNTADECPGSTHNDTLVQIVQSLKNAGAQSVTVAERSYQNFNEVLVQKNLSALAAQHGFSIQNLGDDAITHLYVKSSHWRDGFDFPNTLKNAEFLLSTCCLKTHQYGGHFTMSLKLSVGCIPQYHMNELHGSPYMRDLIAEINAAYSPDLIIMDGIDVFIDGGPMTGTLASPGVFIGGTDRIAVDAVGVAILKDLNSPAITGNVFQQDQIKRAVELGIGISGPDQITWLTDDEESRLYAERLQGILNLG